MTVIDQLQQILPEDSQPTENETWELLRQRITVLSERAWEGKNQWPKVEKWLENFDGRSGLDEKTEKLHALFLLSQFLYIGSTEIRVLLRAIYDELFYVPLVQELRRSLGNSRDQALLDEEVRKALQKTRFLGVGNPSESGVHLLYYFRQENRLTKDLFLDSAAVFKSQMEPDGSVKRSLADPTVERYVFVDDVCGSGETAIEYSKNFLIELQQLNPKAKLYYLCMFALEDGLNDVRSRSKFGDNSHAIFELDRTYKSLSENSRIVKAAPANINPDSLRDIALSYGKRIWKNHPGGFDGNQLLLGFHHNTPDNTLPIIWFEGSSGFPWHPAFRRYHKQ